MSTTAQTTEQRSLWQRITHRKVKDQTEEKTQDTSRLLESWLQAAFTALMWGTQTRRGFAARDRYIRLLRFSYWNELCNGRIFS